MELLATPSGELAVGFARDESTPRGILLDLATGVVARSYEPTESVEGLSRVAPLADGTEVRFASVVAVQDGLSNATYLRAEQPMVVGVVDGSLALKATPEGAPVILWSLPGEIERLQVAPIGPNAVGGFGVTYVAAERVWFGIAKTDGSIIRQAVPLESESRVGKPMLASDGREVSVVYAEGEPGNVPVRIRWARISASSGSDGLDVKVPFVDLPPGGPGGDAIAPDVASLPDGRWLLLWTEGTVGERALRAQTYDAAGRRLGPALRVSPETGNFGQGTVSVVGGRAAVAFLMKSESYQLWGTVLQCR